MSGNMVVMYQLLKDAATLSVDRVGDTPPSGDLSEIHGANGYLPDQLAQEREPRRLQRNTR
jgi:hypothetical protein